MISKFQKGRTINYSKINKNAIANLRYIDNELIKAGYGYFQRLAILGNVQRESSGNPLAISSNGLWHGIIQWDKDRYRIQSNNEKEELKRQTALLLKELEKTGWSGATWKDQIAYAQSFKDSTDLNNAVDIFTRRFVRPGDINGEIQKRLAFAQLGVTDLEDPEYDLETAKRVLPKNLINAWRKNPEKNHLPTGYTDEQGKYHYLKSAQHESYPESREYERTDPETIRAMSMYGNADDYVSRFPVYSPVTSGLPKSVTFDPYNVNKKLIYKPSVLKKASGGLIYKSLIEKKEDAEDNFVYKPLNINNINDLPYNSRFPVEPVTEYSPIRTYYSEESTEQKQESEKTEQEKIEQPKETTDLTERIKEGVIQYANDNINVGNMKELIDLMKSEGISFMITSGLRKGDLTKNGTPSKHSFGDALDIVPIKGQTWDDLLNQMRNSKKFLKYMQDHRLGILDERSKEMQALTGATGPHLHIGPDKKALSNFKLLFG